LRKFPGGFNILLNQDFPPIRPNRQAGLC